MHILENVFEKPSLNELLEAEQNSSQYKSLHKLHIRMRDNPLFLELIFINALLCYQLSSSWEAYWEEFCLYIIDTWNFHLSEWNIQASQWKLSDQIQDFFTNFLPASVWNKRLVPTKLKRLEKILSFTSDSLRWSERFYYENMLQLRDETARHMKQKLNAKTINFAIMMFWYASRIYFWKTIIFSDELCIPIDSRLQRLQKNLTWNTENSLEFFADYADQIWVPVLHLDAFIWGKANNISWLL